MNARVAPDDLTARFLDRVSDGLRAHEGARFASLFGDAVATNSVKPGEPLHPAQVLENMRAAMKALPPPPFEGADRLVVDSATMAELLHRSVVTEKIGGLYLDGGMPVSVDRTYPVNTMMGFKRRGTGVPDELVWCNRFDVKGASEAFSPLGRAA